jgi:hypothetical protein
MGFSHSIFNQSIEFLDLLILNLASHLVLIKCVLQAIPIYLFFSMATPQSVLKTIHNIQRNFLWQGRKLEKKWALVNWDKVCKPNLNGGLGLRDPCMLNEVMGVEIRWCWIKHPKELWERLWKKKYAPHINEAQLIRMTDEILGSNIWNAEW